MSDSIKISIELADAAAQKGLSDFIAKSGNADKGMKKLGDTGSSAFSEIAVNIGKSIGAYEIFQGNLAANLVTKAFELAASAASTLFNTLVVDGVKAAQESQDALNSLNVAMGQAGNYSAEASKNFEEFAKEIQRTTTVEDDAIIKNAALIESMTRLDNEGLKRATKSAIELSAAFGIDLETASRTVAKASEGNFTSLQKLGIQFEKTGTNAGTYENALKAIESLQGTAESKTKTFSGAIEQAKNSFGDLQEEMGNLIIQNPAVTSAINTVSKIIQDATASVKGGSGAFTLLVAEGFVTLIDGTKFVVQALDVMVSGIRIAFNAVMGGVYNLVNTVTGLLAPFSSKMAEVFAATNEAAIESAQTIKTVFENGSLGNASQLLDQVGNAAREGLGKLKSGAEEAAPAIQNVKNSVTELTEEQIRANGEINKYVESLATQNDSIKDVYDSRLEELKSFYELSASIQSESDTVNNELQLQRENDFNTTKIDLLDQRLLAEQKLIERSSVSQATKDKALLAAQRKYETDSEKLAANHTSNLKKTEDLRVANQKSTFATIATLSSSNNSTLAAIGKAAGITQIAIDTPIAVSKALAAFPPPFNFVAAGLVGAAMAAQAAQIAGIQFEDGGIVPGTSYSGDLVQARLNSGEMVLNRTQQAKLFKIANGEERQQSSLASQLQSLVQSVRELASQPIIVNVDGRELFNITRDQLASGRSY